jgi:acetyl esterase/lipase
MSFAILGFLTLSKINMRYLHYLVFGLVIIFSACKKDDVSAVQQESKNDSLPAAVYLDVSYGNSEQQKLDVYLPSQRDEKTRLVIIIHGGGWSAGDKKDFNNYISEFQKRLPGYALANLNYRLVTADGNYFPTQENDIKSAVEFLKSQSGDYNISQNFIYVGISAGAHLALLQGYKHYDVLQPKGIVSFFGPVDLERLYTNSNTSIPDQLKFIMNATLDGNPNIFFESSPINYVTSQSAPTLLLHGDKDAIVPIEQAYMLQQKLEENGVFNKLIVYPGLGHDGWTGNDLNDSFLQVEAFIKGLAN